MFVKFYSSVTLTSSKVDWLLEGYGVRLDWVARGSSDK